MKKVGLIKSLILTSLLVACHSSKKNAANATVENVVSVKEVVEEPKKVEKEKEAPKPKKYQETDPKTCDLIHTKLEVSFDWTYSRLNGKADITLKPHFYDTKMCFLNARGMEIKSLKLLADKSKVKGKEDWAELPSKYSYENDSIIIEMSKVFTKNETFHIIIEYIAKPDELKSKGGSNAISSDKGLYFINPKSENPYKMPQIWTQGETQSNSVWFPTIDSPNQKMTQDIYMTVLDRFTTLSNGLLVDSKKNKDGTRTDHWKMDLPHAPYLVMMAVGEFKKVVDEPWNGKEISYYVEAEYVPHAKAIFGNTKEMIEFYSSKLGVPYAWPKYAQIAVRDYVSGAMENTSATLHGDFAVYATKREIADGNKGEDIISHELFHQWFGDLATCESWSNLPLNESFATYGEYLWEEYKFGADAADYHHLVSRMGYMAQNKQVDLIRFDYHHREDMFDGFSYNKGGQVLHMLRKLVGDDAFFASLKTYLENRKFKTAEIHDLRLAFEEVTGLDMNWFFNQWFLAKGHPELKVSYEYDAEKKMVNLTVEQNQDFEEAPLYRLPLTIDVYENEKPARHLIEIREQKQTFSLPASAKPKLVNFDAERQLLAEIDYEKSIEEYVFQYKHAPKYIDRYEALNKLKKQMDNDLAYTTIKDAAQNDAFYRIQTMAISALNEKKIDKKDELITLMKNIYANSKHNKVKARALEFLNSNYSDLPELNDINDKALSVESIAIVGEALDFFVKKDSKKALAACKTMESDMSKSLLIKIASIYGKFGGEEQVTFFHANMKYFSGFELLSYLSSYIKLAKDCQKAEAAILAANDFDAIAKENGKFTKMGALKGLKDLSREWESREKDLVKKLEEGKTPELEKKHKEAKETYDIITKLYNESK
ncbi:MAG: M1 family metallopeptidase [Bacteroidia bacterium]